MELSNSGSIANKFKYESERVQLKYKKTNQSFLVNLLSPVTLFKVQEKGISSHKNFELQKFAVKFRKRDYQKKLFPCPVKNQGNVNENLLLTTN